MAQSAAGPPSSPQAHVSPSVPPEPRPARRAQAAWRRWLFRTIATFCAWAALVVAAITVLLFNADAPWAKRHVRAAVTWATGLQVDYGSLGLAWPGQLVIRELVVQAPLQVRMASPELLRVGVLRMESPLSTLVRGHPFVEALSAERVYFTLALDEQGRNSFDHLRGGSPAPEAEATPPSQLAERLFGTGLPVRHLVLKDANATVVWVAEGQIVERQVVQGLALYAYAEHRKEGTQLRVQLGSQAAPLTLELRRSQSGRPEQTASLTTSVHLTASAKAAQVVLNMHVVRQDVAPDLPLGQRVQLAAHAFFDTPRKRTDLTISKLIVGDGVATAHAQLELPDQGSPVVRTLRGEANLAELVRTLPAWFVPVRAARGHVHFHAEDLTLDAPTRPSSVDLEGEVEGLQIDLPEGSLSATALRAQVKAQPRDKGLFARGMLAAQQLRVERRDVRIEGKDVALSFVEQWSPEGAMTGRAELGVTALEAHGRSSLLGRDGRFTLETKGVSMQTLTSLAPKGEMVLEGTCGALEYRGALPLKASNIAVQARARRTDRAKVALATKLDAAHISLTRSDGTVFVDDPFRAEIELGDVIPNAERITKTQGTARGQLSLGSLQASVEATLRGGRLEYEAHASVPQVAAVRALHSFLPAQRLSPDTALALHSKGRVMRLGTTPELQQESELRATKVAFAGLHADALTLGVRSIGTALQHAGEVQLDSDNLEFEGEPIGKARLALSGSFDRARSALDLRLESERPAKLSLHASLDGSDPDGSVRFEATGAASELAKLAPFAAKHAAGLDLSQLAVKVRTRGDLRGVLVTSDDPMHLDWSPNPARTLNGRGSLEFETHQLRWGQEDRTLHAPRAVVHTVFEVEPERRRLQSDLRLDALEIRTGALIFELAGWHDQSTLHWTGDLADGVLDFSQKTSIRTLEQNVAPNYPVGDLTWTLRARRDQDGIVKVSELYLVNRAGGTILSATGGIDLSEDHDQLSLRSSLQQDLSRLSKQNGAFAGRGKAVVELSVASPNLRVFQTSAVLHLEDAHVHLPRAQVALEAMDGEIPVLLDFTLGRGGLRLLRGVQVNPYANLRFADQHPMLSTRSFLSIDRVQTPLATFAPFAANLKVEQNIVSLSQIELGVRGGTVTGNGLLDWDGAGSTLELNVHASGVRSSRGEPFDGNAALFVDLGDRSVRGRADILRIGRRHLLDLLDIQDPHHADAGLNHIRNALRLGYPDRVRISFHHGFASAGVSFGGLARFLRVADVRGIPIGPLVERTLRTLKLEEAR